MGGFFALPAVKVLAPILGGALLSKVGGGGRSAPNPQTISPELAAQSRAETALMEQRLEALQELFGRGMNFDDTPIGRLDLPDSDFLDEDFLGSLRPTQGLDLLKFVAGSSAGGSGASNALAGLGQRNLELAQQGDRQRGEAISSILSDVIGIIGDNNAPERDSPIDVLNMILRGGSANLLPGSFSVE